jgi:flavin reductase (DIM6/NTAB) family NADH-FMN oxidoreductase RutF
MRISLPEIDARRLLVPGPVVLVTSRWHGNDNVMPLAWAAPLALEPPLVGIAVHPSRHTHDMINKAQEFALNIPGRDLLNHTHYFGLVTGREIDKLDAARLPTFTARKIDARLMEHCLGWIECGVEEAYPMGDHTLFVGRVVAVQVEDEAFDETWKLDDPDLRPLHYLGGSSYAVASTRLEAKVETADERQLHEALEEQVEVQGEERAKLDEQEAVRQEREGDGAS